MKELKVEERKEVVRKLFKAIDKKNESIKESIELDSTGERPDNEAILVKGIWSNMKYNFLKSIPEHKKFSPEVKCLIGICLYFNCNRHLLEEIIVLYYPSDFYRENCLHNSLIDYTNEIMMDHKTIPLRNVIDKYILEEMGKTNYFDKEFRTKISSFIYHAKGFCSFTDGVNEEDIEEFKLRLKIRDYYQLGNQFDMLDCLLPKLKIEDYQKVLLDTEDTASYIAMYNKILLYYLHIINRYSYNDLTDDEIVEIIDAITLKLIDVKEELTNLAINDYGKFSDCVINAYNTIYLDVDNYIDIYTAKILDSRDKEATLESLITALKVILDSFIYMVKSKSNYINLLYKYHHEVVSEIYQDFIKDFSCVYKESYDYKNLTKLIDLFIENMQELISGKASFHHDNSEHIRSKFDNISSYLESEKNFINKINDIQF